MKEKLMEMLESRKDEMIKIRRYLHKNPELSFKEEKTATDIADFYKDKDIAIETDVGNEHGIVVTIKGGQEDSWFLFLYWLYTKSVKEPYFNHHSKFDIVEDAILVAAKTVGHVTCSYLED
ncbi:hypothetical protein [Paucisalibacillus sp. EB02]|uniref:hypothetical protein n=1 Tax=Paucisalibacillus sp. EB02 TaxID=1347087 RepID=UPI0004B9F635